MSILIDANALIDTINMVCRKENMTMTTETVIGTICHAPAVDAVEVVRCKDCRWSVFNNHYWGKCTYMVRPSLYITEDGYCSSGERKEQ